MSEFRSRRSFSADHTRVYGRPSGEERQLPLKRAVPHSPDAGLGLLHWQTAPESTPPSGKMSTGKRMPHARAASAASTPDRPAAQRAVATAGNPLTTAAAALPPRPVRSGAAAPTTPRAAEPSTPRPGYAASVTSSQGSYARRRSLDVAPVARPAPNPAASAASAAPSHAPADCATESTTQLSTRSETQTQANTSSGRPPLFARSRSVPQRTTNRSQVVGILPRGGLDCPDSPTSPRSPRYFKPPQKVASLREEHHPYQGQPPPVAPPRITGYSGHRPKAWDSVGLNFNRVEMRSDQEYAHEVTYESINNPAFAHYPGERDPAQPRRKPARRPARPPPTFNPYLYPWQNPKNPITGHAWYCASGEIPPPLRASHRVIAPIGHPERYDFIPEDVPDHSHYPNSTSLFAPFCPFDLD
eukprot:EG_transcript_9694